MVRLGFVAVVLLSPLGHAEVSVLLDIVRLRDLRQVLQQVVTSRRLSVCFDQLLAVFVVELGARLLILEVWLVLGLFATLLLAVLLALRRLQTTLVLQLDHGWDSAGVARAIILS